MDTTEPPQKKSYLTPFLMCGTVLLISLIALIISEALFDWYWNEALFLLSPVVLVLLLPFLIKYGFISRSEDSISRLRWVLTVVALIMLSLPTACIVATLISRGQVIEGMYSLIEMHSASPDSHLSTLRLCSILVCAVVFSVIAISFWKIKTLHNTATKSKVWMFTSMALLALTSVSSIIIMKDDLWYYTSEQALMNDSKRYYNNAVASYKLCRPHIDNITKAYDKYLTIQLIDTVFWLSPGNKPINTLQAKDSTYQKLKRMLTLYINGWADNQTEMQMAHNDLGRIIDAEKRFSEPLAKRIDARKIEEYSLDMYNLHTRLGHMYFQGMNNSKELSRRTEELIAIVKLIEDFTGAFTLYNRVPMGTKYSVVTWEAQRKSKIIDERLRTFNAKYHFDEQSK